MRKPATDASTDHAASAGASRRPVIRRPTAEDALDLATEAFAASERVEIAALAAQVSVAQSTIYRWFGSRERLLDQVVERYTAAEWALLGFEYDASSGGVTLPPGLGDLHGASGDQLILGFIGASINPEVRAPLRAFLEREPQLAMRLLVGKDSAFIRLTVRMFSALVAAAYPEEVAARVNDHAELIVQVGMAFRWATFVAGDTPDSQAVITAVTGLLAATRGTDRRQGQ